MRSAVVSAVVVGFSVVASLGARFDEPTTVILGTVRTAVTRTPVARVNILAGAASSDSAGHFVLRVPRSTSFLGLQKSGYLDFQYPFLRLTTDTLVVEVELRTDPPATASYANGHLPFLCVVLDTPDRMTVTNGCYPDSFPHPVSEYIWKVFKQNPYANPNGPYFGEAGDNGGVLVYTRMVAPW